MIGFDESVEARLKRRSIEYGSGQKPTQLYSDTSTMQHFGLTPAQWHITSRTDRKIMHYFRAMEGFYTDIARERIKEKVANKPPAGI